uniref:sigma factor n=1 Tax=Heyndrickxia sp. FSL K6-6286 TaxID=2921510 RepID=UPI00406C9182
MDRQSYNELDQIYRRYAEGLYYYLLHLSGSPSLSEELVQETFYRATISLGVLNIKRLNRGSIK